MFLQNIFYTYLQATLYRRDVILFHFHIFQEGIEQIVKQAAAVNVQNEQATLAVVLPSFIIILLVMAILKNALKNKYVQAVLRGLKPCIIGIILATGVYMTFNHAVADVRAGILTVVLAAIMFGSKPVLKKKIPSILLIVISICIGIFVYEI